MNLSPGLVVKAICPPFLWKTVYRALGPSTGMEEAELIRLWRLPRNTRTTASLLGGEFQVLDGPSFAGSYHTYFRRQQYRFPIGGESPLIIDGGANVGVSVRYWKSLCSGARVLAFEPDPEIFAALVRNCGGLVGVTLRDSALWTNTGSIRFTATGSDGGHLSELAANPDTRKQITVPSIRLRDLLIEPVDLLKLDIEGAEVEVLRDCADRLSCVKWLFVEYHSFVNKPQRLGQFLQIIEKAGFRLYCREEQVSPQPFISRPVHNAKDFHMDIFAFRTLE